MKKFLLGIVLLFVLMAALAVLLPFIVDLNAYQDQYRPLIEDALNRTVSFSDIRLTILPRLGVRIAGFTVKDDPKFSDGAFASLTSLDVGIKLMPLLTGRIEIEEILLRDPVITVIKNRQGVLNISTLGAKETAKGEAPPPRPSPPEAGGPLRALALLAVDELSLTGGRLAYEDHSVTKPADYRVQDLAITLRSVRLGVVAHVHIAATVLPYNLPVTIDGELGPLTETLDFRIIDIAAALGKTVMAVKGSATAGRFNVVLTSPMIESTDLPVSLPLTKPVRVKDLRIATEGEYPLRTEAPLYETVTIKSLALAVLLGTSVVNVEGHAGGGDLTLKLTSSGIDSRDLPLALPLAKPVVVKDLHLKAKAPYPLKEGVAPQEWVDAMDLECLIGFETSHVMVKGNILDGEVKVIATSGSINSDDLPVALPLRQPVEAQDVRLTAGLKGSDARLQNLALTMFDGRLFAQGGLTMGSSKPPFEGNIVLEKMHVGPIVHALTETVSASGTGGMQLTVRGRGFSMPDLTEALVGTGRFAVKDGKIEGFTILQQVFDLLSAAGVRPDLPKAAVFSTIEGEAAIKDGRVNVERFFMDSHDFQAAAKGTIGFDQSLNLKGTLRLSEALSKDLAAVSSVTKLVASKGRMTIPLIVTGTVRSPSYALDGKAMGAKVREQVTEQVKETVEGVLKGKDGKGLDIEKGAEALKKLFGR